MTLRWDRPYTKLPDEFPDIVTKLVKVIQEDGSYDIRSVYTALAALTESYREAMRSMMDKKDEYDSFISSMDIVIQGLASQLTRPVFEKAVKKRLARDVDADAEQIELGAYEPGNLDSEY